MITSTDDTVPDQADTDLRRWMGKGEATLLLKIAESAEKRFQAQALNDAVISDKHPNYLDAANASLKAAQRWRTFIEIFQELSNRKEPFTTVKLS